MNKEIKYNGKEYILVSEVCKEFPYEDESPMFYAFAVEKNLWKKVVPLYYVYDFEEEFNSPDMFVTGKYVTESKKMIVEV